jgi:hypothetical protein
MWLDRVARSSIARMSRRIRRIFIALACLIAAIAILSAVGVSMFKGTPDWYLVKPQHSPARKESSARAAENKLIDARNWAALLRADQVRAAAAKTQGATAPVARAEGSHVIEITQEELDALLDKWSTMYGWRQGYDQFIEDPRLILRDGALILAARVKELGAVASFHFRPAIDDKGQLHLDLTRVAGGKLPLPDAVWRPWRDRIVGALQTRMPTWRQQARIDPAGSANFAAMSATLSRLLFAVLDRRAGEPVLFLPLVERGEAVPVRVTQAAVAQDKLTLVVQPLNSTERAGLLERIRNSP